MSARIEVVSLKIRIGDQTVDLTPEEFKALRDAAKVLLPEEPSKFDPRDYMGQTVWKRPHINQQDLDNFRAELGKIRAVPSLPLIPMGNDYYDPPIVSTTATEP